LSVNGCILSMNYGTDFYRVYTGSFDSATSFQNKKEITFKAMNVLVTDKKNTLTDTFHALDAGISDTVYSSLDYANSDYFFGSGDKEGARLTRYLNGSIQPLILGSNFTGSYSSIRAVAPLSTLYNTELLVGGKFYYSNGQGVVMNFGEYN